MIGLFTPVDNLHAPDEGFSLPLMENAISAFEEIIQKIAIEK
jgi:acetylornithine deacetylase/succinyl-diaminopimelate desuccinylase-like protein